MGIPALLPPGSMHGGSPPVRRTLFQRHSCVMRGSRAFLCWASFRGFSLIHKSKGTSSGWFTLDLPDSVEQKVMGSTPKISSRIRLVKRSTSKLARKRQSCRPFLFFTFEHTMKDDDVWCLLYIGSLFLRLLFFHQLLLVVLCHNGEA